MRVIFDGAYLFGVTDLTESATTQEKTQELLILFGFEFPFPSVANKTSTPAPENKDAH
jgi:hypothetical protein